MFFLKAISMKYDIATKVLMDKAGARILEKFLGIGVEYLELVEELPQETFQECQRLFRSADYADYPG